MFSNTIQIIVEKVDDFFQMF